MTLHPVAHSTVVEKLFDLAGIKAEDSQAGLLTRRIVEQLGGLDRAQVLQVRGVRKLLQKLKPDESVRRNEGAERIFDGGSLAQHSDILLSRGERPNDRRYHIFDLLLEKGVLRPGLDLPCGYCRLSNWLTPHLLDDSWSCAYCGHENKTSTMLYPHGEWKYRKSGFFARDNNQEGALPVILTLSLFNRTVGHGAFIYLPSLKLTSNGVKCETDFCILHMTRNKVEVGIGECKSGGGRIKEQDVINLRRVRDELVRNGVDCYLVFAKTADHFLWEELDLFRRLTKGHVPVILLTSHELEPHFPYKDPDVPRTHVGDLCDFSINSEHLYLRNVAPFADEGAGI